ncbi:hypothetical protein LguiB_027650 [Lonicera macranthoides]
MQNYFGRFQWFSKTMKKEKEVGARIGKETSPSGNLWRQEFDHLGGTSELTEITASEDVLISPEDIGLENVLEDAKVSSTDKLVSHIAEMLQDLEPCMSSKCCIYKVPERLRKLNKQAYSPRVVSIGPFHYGSKRLTSMEALKKRYFKKLIEKSRTRLRIYVELVKDFEGKARECYAEPVVMRSDEFVSMLLIDACFIIELLLRSYYKDWNKEDEHVLSKPCEVSG